MSFSYVNKYNFQIRPQLSNLQEHVKSRHDEYDAVIQRTEELENCMNKYVGKLYDLEKRFSEFKTFVEAFDKDLDERVTKQRADFDANYRSSEYRLAGVRNELLGVTNDLRNSLTTLTSQLATSNSSSASIESLSEQLQTLNDRLNQVESLGQFKEDVQPDDMLKKLQQVESRLIALEEATGTQQVDQNDEQDE